MCIGLKSGIISDDKKALNACRILKIRFTTVPRLAIEFYKRGFIEKNEIDLIINKLQKFGRYSNEILDKMKGDIK